MIVNPHAPSQIYSQTAGPPPVKLWIHPVIWTLLRQLQAAARKVCNPTKQVVQGRSYWIAWKVNHKDRLVHLVVFGTVSRTHTGIALVSISSRLQGLSRCSPASLAGSTDCWILPAACRGGMAAVHSADSGSRYCNTLTVS